MGKIKEAQQILLDQFYLVDVGIIRMDGDDPRHKYIVRTDVQDKLEKVGRKDLGRFWNRVRTFTEAHHPDAVIWILREADGIRIGVGWMTNDPVEGAEETGYGVDDSSSGGRAGDPDSYGPAGGGGSGLRPGGEVQREEEGPGSEDSLLP